MPLLKRVSTVQAEHLAFEFLSEEWLLSPIDQGWLILLTSRYTDNHWYIVELGVQGSPDRWIIQVYDNGECDPNYTFDSPLTGHKDNANLSRYPQRIADMIYTERNGWLMFQSQAS